MKRYINGKYVELTEKDITRLNSEQIEYEKTEEYKQFKISELKQKLTETNYIACMIAEGSATKEEYSEEIAQRKMWREEINRLEAEAMVESMMENAEAEG